MTVTETRPIAKLRRRRRWPWVVLGGFVIAAVIGALHSPWLSVREVEILGASHADVAARIDSTGVGEGAILIWVDTGDIVTAVAADPWVRDVRVDREWPDRLVVEVSEHQPVVWIEGIIGWMLVSAHGTVLETAARPGPGLLRAELAFPDLAPGAAPDDPTWDEIVQMAVVLEQPLAAAVVLQHRGPEVWTRVRDHDIRLGHPIDLADKARTMQAILSEGLPPGVTLDLISPLRPALVGDNVQPVVEG